jgi:hypothetical protein
VDQVRAQALEGLRLIAIEIGSRRNYSFIEQGGWSIGRETQQELERTTEWREFEDELLALAEASQKPAGKDANTQMSLLELPETTKRKWGGRGKTLNLIWPPAIPKPFARNCSLFWAALSTSECITCCREAAVAREIR